MTPPITPRPDPRPDHATPPPCWVVLAAPDGGACQAYEPCDPDMRACLAEGWQVVCIRRGDRDAILKEVEAAA
jgi:hypothetical protein